MTVQTMGIKDKEFKGYVSADELLDATNMAFIAQEHELITSAGVVCDQHKAIVRSDTNKYIGIVGKDYGVVQPAESFALLEAVTKEKGALFTKAKTFYGGSRIIAEVTLPMRPKDWIRDRGNAIRRIIRIVNSFDGSTIYGGEYGVEVLICTNGMKTFDREATFRLRRTKNIDDRKAEALKIFAGGEKYFDLIIARARQLTKKIMTKDMLKKYVAELFPADAKTKKVSTRNENQRHEVERLFFEGMGSAGRDAWDAYNALTEYLDHHRFTDKEKAERANLFGTGAKLKARAFAYLESRI